MNKRKCFKTKAGRVFPIISFYTGNSASISNAYRMLKNLLSFLIVYLISGLANKIVKDP